MKVSDLGEFGLIEALAALVARRQPATPAPQSPPGAPGGRLLLGIGDDCAAWQVGGVTQLVTTDTLVQGVHFDPRLTSWRDLGWKSLAVNLSDIAAMGGQPDYALVTLGLPQDTPAAAVLELYEGLLDCACAHGALVVGGDIVGAAAPLISITLLGHAGGTMTFPHNLLLRSAAQTGDAIAVTGWLGASAAGLRLLQAGAAPAASTVLLDVHRRPTPRLEAGRLALEAGVRCGMDVSDGLVGDLEKLCRASGLAAAIDLPSVPVAPEARAAFPQDWQRLALAGGEDYELLLVAPAEVLDAVAERSALPVTVVGRTLPGPPGQVTVRDAEGRPVPTGAGGWDHLARR